tara:strand:+ start:5743 stop:6246 length:504 start_codon:yes stop_codon:yes gene_type:complete
MKKSINRFYFFPLFFTILPAQSVLDKYGDRIELLGIPFKGPMELCQIFIAIFLFIAFFQSGLDKVIDRKGNLDFLKAHFSDTPLIKIIPIMLLILTFLEIIGSLMLGYGVYYAFVNRSTLWIFYGFVVIAITIIILFAGQRIAKDYLGAADLVPYFILIMLGIMSMY